MVVRTVQSMSFDPQNSLGGALNMFEVNLLCAKVMDLSLFSQLGVGFESLEGPICSKYFQSLGRPREIADTLPSFSGWRESRVRRVRSLKSCCFPCENSEVAVGPPTTESSRPLCIPTGAFTRSSWAYRALGGSTRRRNGAFAVCKRTAGSTRCAPISRAHLPLPLQPPHPACPWLRCFVRSRSFLFRTRPRILTDACGAPSRTPRSPFSDGLNPPTWRGSRRPVVWSRQGAPSALARRIRVYSGTFNGHRRARPPNPPRPTMRAVARSPIQSLTGRALNPPWRQPRL